VESILGPRGAEAITWPIVPVPGDCEDGEVGGMKCCWQGKPKYSEKTCPDAILSTTNPTCQTRARTRAAAGGSQRLTAFSYGEALLISVRACVEPRAIVRPEILGKLKKSASSGLEVVTFLLLAQCLNQLRYRMPHTS
jgi:hypothetical protein